MRTEVKFFFDASDFEKTPSGYVHTFERDVCDRTGLVPKVEVISTPDGLRMVITTDARMPQSIVVTPSGYFWSLDDAKGGYPSIDDVATALTRVVNKGRFLSMKIDAHVYDALRQVYVAELSDAISAVKEESETISSEGDNEKQEHMRRASVMLDAKLAALMEHVTRTTAPLPSADEVIPDEEVAEALKVMGNFTAGGPKPE